MILKTTKQIIMIYNKNNYTKASRCMKIKNTIQNLIDLPEPTLQPHSLNFVSTRQYIQKCSYFIELITLQLLNLLKSSKFCTHENKLRYLRYLR